MNPEPVPTRDKWVIIFTFILIAAGIMLSYLNMSWYEEYIREDGFIEWLTVASLLGCAGICITRTFKLFTRREFLFLISTFLLGIVCIFGAGEELSWGQRIFGIESTEFFEENNAQQETNLHNLKIKGVKINKLLFGPLLGVVMVIYLFGLPFFYRRSEKINKLVKRFAVPVPRLYHGLAFVILYLLTLLPPTKGSELLEFGGCILFMLIVINPVNKYIFKIKAE